MRITSLSAGIFILLLSCTQAPHKVALTNDNGTNDPGGDDVLKDGSTDTEGSKDLQLRPEAGSKMRFLDGRALTAVYSRVFAKDEWGFAHCARDKPKDYDGCDLLFSRDERPAMGTFDLYSQRMGRGLQNVNKTENLTLNYMRNLRSALSRECERLVTREEKALSADPAAKTILVKADGPTKASLAAYFSLLMDDDGKGVDFAVPFDDYVKAFKTALNGENDPAKAKANAYLNLCLSLSMEPQVFLY